jgi:hypothetical protein
MRKSMLTLVRGGEDGPKADELLLAYKKLISALENLDATATLGMQSRSKKIMDDPFLLSLQYDEVEKALGVFIEVGAAAASMGNKRKWVLMFVLVKLPLLECCRCNSIAHIKLHIHLQQLLARKGV